MHIVTGMPMTVGMGMRVAITMGTKKHMIGIAHGYSHGHALYIWAVPMTLSMGTLEIRNFVFSYHQRRWGASRVCFTNKTVCKAGHC